MIELTDTKPRVDVLEAEYVRLLGYPHLYELDGRSKELAEWAREWYREHGRPWIYARQVENVSVNADTIHIEGMQFKSVKLAEKFTSAEADGAFVAAVSAGKECEEMARQLWLQEKPDEYFFLEMYGSAVVEHLIARTGFQFCDWADRQHLAILPHYSPGYPGWDISEQQRLLDVIRRHIPDALPGELSVLPTGMLNPKKSLLAVFGVTRNLAKVARLTDLVPCKNCSLPACQYRRVPYRKSMPQIESIQRLRSELTDSTNEPSKMPSPLSRNAQYRTGMSALKKWSKERLRLRFAEDGTVEATFTYDGTTCSNLGRPLQFILSVRLGSEQTGYKILSTDCFPAPGDEGHKSMCEYIRRGDPFIESIREEKPLAGKSLEEVLAWERPFSPTGCFCERPGRLHKWGLALEVLHFALANMNEHQHMPTRLVHNHNETTSSNPKESLQ